jgi:hypothetical protein
MSKLTERLSFKDGTLKSQAPPNEQKIKPVESIFISGVHFTLSLPQARRVHAGKATEGQLLTWGYNRGLD